MDLSRSRQRLRALCQGLDEAFEIFLARAPLFPGTVYDQKIRCGKPQCKCAHSDYRHQLRCVSYVEGGRSRTRSLPEPVRAEMEEMASQYRGFREAQRQMRERFDAILEELEAIRRERSRQGLEHYARMAARSGRGRAAGGAARKEPS